VKIVTIKSILLFLIVLSLAFSFPAQVLTSNPLLALTPYALLACVFLLTAYQRHWALLFRWSAHKRITLLIGVFLISVIFHTGWQTLFGFISPYRGVSSIVIFVLPALFFVYFRGFATDREYRVVFFAMFLAGFISGVFFVYDSYSMMILGQVNDYSHSAMKYIELRAGAPGQNMARVSPFNRSHGLLEKHSASAAWIVLGCFGILTLLSKKKSIIRMIVVVVFSLTLLIALNVTSIALFAVIVFGMEYGGFSLLRGVITKRMNLLLPTIIIGLILVGLGLLVHSKGYNLFITIQNLIGRQLDLVSGTNNESQVGYFGNLILTFISYPYDISEFPLGVLIGDGYSTFGYTKGSDFGIIESLHRFGVPLFFAIIFGLTRLIRRALKQMYYYKHRPPEEKYLWFAVSATMYIVLNDVHYSIWALKSILPIMFINLAIFDRYLYPKNKCRAPQ
jgi:hypothetical protein